MTITVTIDWDLSEDPADAHWTLTPEQADVLDAWLTQHVGQPDTVH